MTDLGRSATSDRRSILDIDAEHFDRRTRAIKDELRAFDDLYLSPRIKGALRDLRAELDVIIAERKAGL